MRDTDLQFGEKLFGSRIWHDIDYLLLHHQF